VGSFIIFTLGKILSPWSRKILTYATHVEFKFEMPTKTLVRKQGRRGPFGTLSRGWMDNIKTDLKEICAAVGNDSYGIRREWSGEFLRTQ
jgi:hypothetical protein